MRGPADCQGMVGARGGPQVGIVDYGLGNLRSVRRGLERAGGTATILSDPGALSTVDAVVLPGVGAFGEGMENAGPFRAAIQDVVAAGTPLFGICLGMQMLLSDSEEAAHAGQGEARGLDLIPGTNVRFDASVTVPHMGWNDLTVRRDHPLVAGVDGEYAYFVHSYYPIPDDETATVATTTYDVKFPSVIADASGRVFGTQFHPEKSGETGARILRNFVDIATD